VRARLSAIANSVAAMTPPRVISGAKISPAVIVKRLSGVANAGRMASAVKKTQGPTLRMRAIPRSSTAW
jgi:hypothetical protein